MAGEGGSGCGNCNKFAEGDADIEPSGVLMVVLSGPIDPIGDSGSLFAVTPNPEGGQFRRDLIPPGNITAVSTISRVVAYYLNHVVKNETSGKKLLRNHFFCK